MGSTALLAIAFHFRIKNTTNPPAILKELLLLLPIAAMFFSLYKYIATYSDKAATLGAILFSLSTFLLWRALAVLFFKTDGEDRTFLRLVGILGACGIVANYVLYSINLSIRPIPRDLVIQVYYWGQAFAAWSFLKKP